MREFGSLPAGSCGRLGVAALKPAGSQAYHAFPYCQVNPLPGATNAYKNKHFVAFLLYHIFFSLSRKIFSLRILGFTSFTQDTQTFF